MRRIKRQRYSARFCLFLTGVILLPAAARGEVDNWAVELSVKAPLVGSEDPLNLAGVLPSTTDGYDPDFDSCNPPPVPVDPNLSFPHPEYGLPFNLCTTDFRAPFDATKEWRLLVETDLYDTEIVIAWDLEIENAIVPEEYKAVLKNDLGRTVANLRQVSEYRYNSGNPPMDRTFFLFVSNDPPPAPAQVLARPGDGKVRLSWSASSATDVATYLYRYEEVTGPEPSGGEVVAAVTEVLIGELENGTAYRFQVASKDRTGLVGSYTEAATATPWFDGDVQADGWIDYLDLWQLAVQWGKVENATGDLTQDGRFDEEDMLAFFSRWHLVP